MLLLRSGHRGELDRSVPGYSPHLDREVAGLVLPPPAFASVSPIRQTPLGSLTRLTSEQIARGAAVSPLGRERPGANIRCHALSARKRSDRYRPRPELAMRPLDPHSSVVPPGVDGADCGLAAGVDVGRCNCDRIDDADRCFEPEVRRPRLRASPANWTQALGASGWAPRNRQNVARQISARSLKSADRINFRSLHRIIFLTT